MAKKPDTSLETARRELPSCCQCDFVAHREGIVDCVWEARIELDLYESREDGCCTAREAAKLRKYLAKCWCDVLNCFNYAREQQMDARKLVTIEEHELGDEDRVFRTADAWYWQPRGSSECFGPYKHREEAEADYAEQTAPVIFVYNENCVMAGHPVPRSELERYDDPNDCWDWTGVEATEKEAEEYERRGRWGCKVAETIREFLK